MTGRRSMTVALTLLLTIWAGVPGMAQERLTLEDAIRRAQGDTPEARALASAVDAAATRIRLARSGFWPRVDVIETAQRGNQPVFVFGSLLSQGRFGAANFAIPALNEPDPLTNTRTTLSIDLSIFDAGRTRLGVQAATYHRDLAVAGRDDGRQALGYRAAGRFVRVLQLEAAVRAADAAVAAAESDHQRTRARRDVGLVTDADVLSLDVHLADMRQRRITAAGELTVARIELAEAVGVPLDTPLALAHPEARTPSPDPEVLVREALGTHPQIRDAQLRVDLADNTRRAARASLLPTLAVHGGWELNGETPGAQRTNWIVGAELRMNLFRGFADASAMAEARHAHRRASQEREQVQHRIEVGVRGAIARLDAARAREAAGRAALVQARESQRIVRDRYESGLATVTDMLRAAEAALDAESRATAAEMDVILHTVALDRAAGRL